MSVSTFTNFREEDDIGASQPLDVELVRADFPILERRVHGKPLIYLDSAATSQKPVQVIEKVTEFYWRYRWRWCR